MRPHERDGRDPRRSSLGVVGPASLKAIRLAMTGVLVPQKRAVKKGEPAQCLRMPGQKRISEILKSFGGGVFC